MSANKGEFLKSVLVPPSAKAGEITSVIRSCAVAAPIDTSNDGKTVGISSRAVVCGMKKVTSDDQQEICH
jgi:hypothetical protein